MDKAFEAKFGMRSKGPNMFLIPRFFFKVLFFLFLFQGMLFAKEHYDVQDIQKVMQKLFSQHVENKNLCPTIMKRMIKIYIDRFDPKKIYLLKEEIFPFVNINDKKAKKIISNIEKNDFSDFYNLNEIFRKAIYRSKNNFLKIKDVFLQNDFKKKSFEKSVFFAKSEQELFERQEADFFNFYKIQNKISKISSLERKKKLLSLFEKRKEVKEKKYFFSNPVKKNHFFVLSFLKSFSNSLDAHTYFFTEEEAKEMRISLEKEFEGIGVFLSETIDGVAIVNLVENGPAKESSLIEINDIIKEVNGKNIENISFEEVLELIKVKKKGKITLGLKRGDRRFKVSLVPKVIEMEKERVSFSYEPFGNGIIGKIILNSFYENEEFSSEKDVIDAISKLRKIGNLKGLILDFRENSGGFLSQAIKISGIFLSSSVVVISKYFDGQVRYLRNFDQKNYFKGPILVLTSKFSASAAEIVAQALQDYGVALIVGDKRTFGKGTIQYQTVTDKDAKYFYKVTIGKYFTASGRSTQIRGAKADIVIPSIYHSYHVGEKYLQYSLPQEKINGAFEDSLEDLDDKEKRILQRYYLPYLQRRVLYWNKMVPLLKTNSLYRQSNDTLFVDYLKKISKKEKIEKDPQIKEAINILKDMIYIDIFSRYVKK